jgi:hypothetical protein
MSLFVLFARAMLPIFPICTHAERQVVWLLKPVEYQFLSTPTDGFCHRIHRQVIAAAALAGVPLPW